jgi:uncharacterized protein
MTVTIERRYATLTDVEVRETDGGGLRFSGHAAVFNSPTDLGPFREQVAPGAFKRSIRTEGSDVRLLFNHEPDSVMARTINGTLKLREDGTGLLAEADLDPSDFDVQRLLPKLRSGNVSQMSFGFRAVGEDDSWWDDDEDGGKPLRTLREVQLFDVSAVTFPAYDDTDAALNSIARGTVAVAEARGLDADRSQVIDHLRELPTVSPEQGDETPAQEVRETPEDDPAPAETPRHSPSRSHLEARLDYLASTL